MLRNFCYGSILLCAAMGGMPLAWAQTTAKLSDGQILEYLQTVNDGEIGDAKMALRETKSKEVKAFAKHMQEDHSKSRKAIRELAKKGKIDLSKSEVTLALENQAAAGDRALKAAKGADFDKQYARAQAKMHAEVATTLQSKLMPLATSAAVKSVLAQTLSTVQEHQRMAEDLAGRL